MKTGMVRMIHRGCGAPAFLYNLAALVPGTYMQAVFAQHLDGRAMASGLLMCCDSCGAPIGPFPGSELEPEIS